MELVYYMFDLTWEFTNPVTNNKHTFTQTRRGELSTTYKKGDKKNFYVYYNDDENHFRTAESVHTILFVLFGFSFLIFAAVDLIGKSKRKKKQAMHPPMTEENSFNGHYLDHYE